MSKDNEIKKVDGSDTPFAVIETGGKQYIVRKGDKLKIEKLSDSETYKKGDKVVFDSVLLIDDGSKTKIGNPFIEDAKVEAKFIENGKSKKLHVIRFRAKSRYFRKYGHRQPYTFVEITNI